MFRLESFILWQPCRRADFARAKSDDYETRHDPGGSDHNWPLLATTGHYWPQLVTTGHNWSFLATTGHNRPLQLWQANLHYVP